MSLLLSLEKVALQWGSHWCLQLPEGWVQEGQSLFQRCQVAGQGSMNTNWRLLLNIKKHFFNCVCNWALVHVAQRGCKVSFLEVFKRHLHMVLSRCDLLEQGIGWDEPRCLPANCLSSVDKTWAGDYMHYSGNLQPASCSPSPYTTRIWLQLWTEVITWPNQTLWDTTLIQKIFMYDSMGYFARKVKNIDSLLNLRENLRELHVQ